MSFPTPLAEFCRCAALVSALLFFPSIGFSGWTLPSPSPAKATQCHLEWTGTTSGTSVAMHAMAPGSSTWSSLGGSGGTPGSVKTISVNPTFSTAGVWSLKITEGASPDLPAIDSTMLNVTDPNDHTLPSVPSNLTGSNLTGTSFTLSWGASTDNVWVWNYDVMRDSTLLTPATAGTSRGITGLTPATTYAMKVRARDSSGNVSAWSPLLDVTTPDTLVPGAPVGLAMAGMGEDSVTLNWFASTDNVAVTGYEVMRDVTSLGTITQTSTTITGLTPGTTYALKVRARDAAGNWSAWSALWMTMPPGGAPPASGTLAAALPGEVSVDNKGAANYTIPLSIAPGRSGMQPSLALSYASNAGNGPLGIGWSLSTGFPQSITRGRSILARDGVTRGVNFDANDKFYLDGKRLIVVSGTYGAPGSTYRTEVDSFVTITAAGASGSIDTFTVTDKTGTKMIFGRFDSGDSTPNDGYQKGGGETAGKAFAYALKCVEDAVRNRILFEYNEDLENGEYTLKEIRYSANTSPPVAPLATVTFQYDLNVVPGNPAGVEARRDQTSRYVAMRVFRSTKRLDRIVSEFSGGTGIPTFSQYNLTYDYAPNFGPTRLISVQASIRDMSDPTNNTLKAVRPTTVTWSGAPYDDPNNPDDPPIYSTAPNVVIPSSLNSSPNTWAFGDVNGDGRDDLVICAGVQLSNGSGFGGGWSMPTGAGAQYVKLGDINGDGLKDVVYSDYFGSGNKLYAVVSTGSSFVGLGGGTAPTEIFTFTDEFRDPITGTGHFLEREMWSASSRICLADFTGDGRDDILIHRYDGKLKLLKSDGTSFSALAAFDVGAAPLQGVESWESWSVQYLGFILVDNFSVSMIPCELNGDGITDYAWVQSQQDYDAIEPTSLHSAAGGKKLFAVTSQPGGGFSEKYMVFEWSWGMLECQNADHRKTSAMVMPGDVNGDGLTDFVYLNPGMIEDDGCVLHHMLLLSEGAAGVPQFEAIPAPIPTWVSADGLQVRPWFDKVTQGVWQNEYALMFFTHPEQPALLFAAGLSSGSDNVALVDVNHDGQQDYVWYVSAPSRAGWWVMYSLGSTFSEPQKVPLGWRPTQQLAQTGSTTLMMATRNGLDLNGDGIQDYAYAYANYSSTPGIEGFHMGVAGQPGTRVVAVANGFGSATTILYAPITNSAVYTAGKIDNPATPSTTEGVKYPIRELRNATYVVSDVLKDSGGSTPAHFSYQYSGNRLDLSGRGSLGFHSFVTLDRQTNLFKYQFLAQSFPMTGLTHREQTYRYWESGANVNFRLISSHDNTVVFDEVVSAGGGAYGTVYPFMSRAVESRWENSDVRHFPEVDQPEWPKAGSSESKPELLFPKALPPGAHITITAESRFDNQTATQTTFNAGVPFNPSDFKVTNPEATRNVVVGVDYFPTYLTSTFMPRQITHGNLHQLATNFGDGFTETVTTTYHPGQTIDGVLTLTGLAATVETSVTSPDYGTESAPTKSFTYLSGTPLVASETVDAPGTELDLTTTYTRDTLGRITTTSIAGFDQPGHPQHVGSYPASRIAAYDDRFDLPATTQNADPYNHTTTTAYHPFLGQPTSVTDPNGAEVTTQYDALGRVIRVTDVLKGLSTDTEYAWTSSGATDWKQTQTVTPPSGVTGALTLSSVHAVRTTATVQPPVTAYFDRLGRTLRTVREGYAGQKTLTDTVYNVLGQVVAVSLPYKSGTSPLWTTTTYDVLGRVATVIAPNGTLTTNTYQGRTTQVTVDALENPDMPTGPHKTSQKNATLVDAKGRTVKVWNPDPATGNVDLSATASIEYRLDGFGRMRDTVLQGQAQLISATYDALGRQTSLNDPDKGLWHYTNNALGQVVEQTDAKGNFTRSFFDRLGRQLTRITKEPSNGPIETAQWFYYDTVTDTALHRVAQGNVTFGGRTVKGWIGAPEREEASTTSTPGGLGYAPPPAITTHYYDAKGRPAVDVATTDGKWFYTYTDYDEVSRVAEVRHYWREPPNENPTTLPDEWKDWGYTYTYDGSGSASKSYVTQVRDTIGNRIWWDVDPTTGYDHLDRPVKVKKGNGYWTTREYRASDGVLTAIKTGSSVGSAQVQNLSFNFDGLGNLVSRGNNVGAMNNLGAINRTETFVYDNLNRLTSSTVTGVATRTTAYAANGNMTAKHDVTGATGTYQYGATVDLPGGGTRSLPHAVSSAFGYSMGYDANGNLLTKSGNGKTWYTRWAGFDKPRWLAMDSSGADFTAGVVGSEFHYNAARQRVMHLEFDSMTAGSPDGEPAHYTRKRLYALGSTVEIDYKNLAATGTPDWSFDKIRIYVPGPDGIIGVREYKPNVPQELPKVYHYDHLGSIECVTPHGSTATIGAVLSLDDPGKPARYSYDPWGERRNPVTWTGKPLATETDKGGYTGVTPRGFTGHEMLDDLGLVHMNGRIYDPLIGRFLSADLVVQFPLNLQSFNRYSYVLNNPLRYTDPSGFETEDDRKKREEAERQARQAAESRARGDVIASQGLAAFALGFGNAQIAAAGQAAVLALRAADQAEPAEKPAAETVEANVPVAESDGSVNPVDPPATEAANSAGYGQAAPGTVAVATNVDAFPYANTNGSDCSIACFRTLEEVLTGRPARSRDDVIALLGRPAGAFEQNGEGLLGNTTDLMNAVFNPIGFSVARRQADNLEALERLLGEGNPMAVGRTVNIGGLHIFAVVPVAPDYSSVTIYNRIAEVGYARIETLPIADAARQLAPRGYQGQIWVVTPQTSPPSGP